MNIVLLKFTMLIIAAEGVLRHVISISHLKGINRNSIKFTFMLRYQKLFFSNDVVLL